MLILKIIPRRGFTIQLLSAKKCRMKTEEPIIYIKAINPGYTVDGVSNVGEMIELARRTEDSDTPLSLAGLKIGYTNSSGNSVSLLEFPEGSWMTGESILLRFSGSPESESANLSYLKTIAFKAGPLELILDGKIIDSVCWTGKEGCFAAFNSASPTTLVRDDKTFEFLHLESYEPKYDSSNYHEDSVQDETPPKQCQNLEFSEILSYYESSQSEQFIEIHNPTADQVLLNDCQIRYKNKTYKLSGIAMPDSYWTYYPTAFALTKNPTSSNKIELLDTDDSIVDVLEYGNGQKKSTSYAQIGHDETGQEIWKSTYSITPGEPNNFQQYRNCPEGKYINTETGNCVNVTIIEEKTCQEGYYLNPATGRCKKLTINEGADYALVPETFQEEKSFVALYALIGVILIGVAYIIFQFRHEIKRLFDKVFQRVRRKHHRETDRH